ncbi:hypothetical protein GCM10023200_05700 [Actinomycetospora chlora]|uniref:Uncharacterized protein n=1 Tax=Actinomycetospora chlora TaxID=663608 RepID=A0ABP9A927_9PSEU
MGHHSRGRSPRAAGSHRAERAGAVAREPGSPVDPVPATGVGDRDLADLADAARTARRTGWPFGSEVLASADTRPSAVPSLPTTPTEQPPAGPRPRRYATSQPTAPFEAVRSA